jgi:hypothetical protein
MRADPLRKRTRKTVQAASPGSTKRRSRPAANLAAPAVAGRVVPDQLEVSLQDLCWLRVGWEIGRSSLDRAAAVLGADWHRAVAVLRVSDVTGNDHSRGTARILSEIELPPGPRSWFVRIEHPEHTYRVTLGFRARSGRFHPIIQSRPITPAKSVHVNGHAPRPATHVEDAEGWPLDLYAGRNPALSPSRPPTAVESAASIPLPAIKGAVDAASPIDAASLPLQVEAELIVRGATAAGARLSLMGRPTALSQDGRFCQRVPVQPGRQVVPVVATSADRAEERTVVFALELSVRELEPRLFGEF